jgi:hypothetical protein
MIDHVNCTKYNSTMGEPLIQGENTNMIAIQLAGQACPLCLEPFRADIKRPFMVHHPSNRLYRCCYCTVAAAIVQSGFPYTAFKMRPSGAPLNHQSALILCRSFEAGELAVVVADAFVIYK